MKIKDFVIKYNFTIILLLVITVIEIFVLSSQSHMLGVPELESMMMIILLAVGMGSGILGGWIGTGGCSVMLPILHFVLGFPAPIAIGTTLFAVIFTAISGGYGHFKQKNVDKNIALWMGGSGILGVVLGSWLFTFLSSKSALLGFIIGIVFLWPSFRMIWEGISGFKDNNTAKPEPETKNSNTELSMFGAGVGVLTGIVGLGGGYALVPGLIYLFGVPVYTTMGTSLAIMIPMAIVGGLIKLAQGYVFLGAALLLAIGTIVGAQIGAATIKCFKPRTLKLIFGVYFLYVAVKFIGNFVGINVW